MHHTPVLQRLCLGALIWMVFHLTTGLEAASVLRSSSAVRAGMSQERLSRIDQMLDDAVQSNEIPGAVALIARRGKVVLHKAYGTADPETGVPMQSDSIFRIASQTKAITSTAVMMLWEEGHFQLDDPIERWIPAFKSTGVLKSYDETTGHWTTEPVKQPITIRHLLTHTSGLGYGVIDGDERMKKIYQQLGVTDLFTTEPVTIGQSVMQLAKCPLHHHPGERFTYSEGLDVLGYFVEIISGMSFADFLHERIFEPLGMKDTGFYLPASKNERLVKVQTKKDDQWVCYPVTFYDPDYPIKGARSFYSGGAGLSSTAKDYTIFLQMYLNGGSYNGQRILSRSTIATIMQNQTGRLFGGEEKFHGLAFGVLREGGVAKGGLGSAGTFDWGGYFNTQYFADPQEEIVGVLMKQTQGISEETAWKYRLLIHQAIDD